MKLTDASGFKLGSVSVLAIYSGSTKVYPTTVGTTFQNISFTVSYQYLNKKGRLISGFGFQDVSVTASSNLPVSVSIISGAGGVLQQIAGQTWRISESNLDFAETVIIQATQSGNSIYSPATANYAVTFHARGHGAGD